MGKWSKIYWQLALIDVGRECRAAGDSILNEWYDSLS